MNFSPCLRTRLSVCAGVAGVIACFAGGSPLASAQTPAFYNIGDLPGGLPSSGLTRVSRDGRVAVGASHSGAGQEAVYWTRDGGLVSIGDLPGGEIAGSAFAVSDDGSVIVGSGRTRADGNNEAFRWTAAGGMQPVGLFPTNFFTEGRAVSGDGSRVYGFGASANGIEAFRRTAGAGIVGLGDLPGGSFYSIVTDASSDGTVVTGWGSVALSTHGSRAHAVRWDAAGAMQDLGIPADFTDSAGLGVSPDGSTIVGSAGGANGARNPTAWTWTEGRGFTLLRGPLNGIDPLSADDVSDTGVVVGTGIDTLTGQNAAYVWDAANGVRSLGGMLQSQYGLDLGGLRPVSAYGISADGLTIVGSAFTPTGEFRGYVAVLPEPAVLGWVGVGALSLRRPGAGRRRAWRG